MPPALLQTPFSCAPVGEPFAHRLGPYHGYVRPGAPGRPLFSFEEAERVLGDWKALPAPEAAGGRRYEAHYNSNHRAFWFYEPEADEWHKWEGEDAGVASLYPIGEGVWQWECRV